MPVNVRSVVFGTDLHERTLAAGRYAALFARRADAELVVAHAMQLAQAAVEVEALTHAASAQRRDVERALAELTTTLGALAGRATSLLGDGDPVDLMRTAAAGRGPSLVVLGTHGAGGLEHHLIGSVAEEILRTVDGPVLTVGPHVAVPEGPPLLFKRVLYATDFSPAAVQAARSASNLAHAFGSAFDALYVVPGGVEGGPTSLNDDERRVQATLERFVGEHPSELADADRFVAFGEIHERVLAHARERGVDLVVLGAHHHSWLERHLRTGPAYDIIRAAPCPVLTICG